MKKFFIVAGALVALAVPSAAMAAPQFTGVSSNANTTNDVVGYAVSAGNYNYKNGSFGFSSTGEARSALNQTSGPGAVADVIHSVQAQSATYEAYGPFAPPSQP
jgi:hypothetical protein